MSHSILVIEDEHRIAQFLAKGLRAEGWSCTVVGDGDTGLTAALSDDVDLVILDLGLPGRDGFGVLTELRRHDTSLPVIVLTARDEVDATVRALDAGADDYLTKPFRFPELAARVRARLRTSSEPTADVLVAGDVELDLRRRTVTAGGRSRELSAREFSLAQALFEHPGQVLSRTQLLSRVWGYDYQPDSNVVDVYVGYLRRKIGRDRITTIRGVGYRLET